MSFLRKKLLISILLIVYILSYFFQSWFFVNIGGVFAENPTDRTNLVAIFVDKDLYQNIKSDIDWYATDYIQKKISNSKALILPINTKNFKAIDLTKMLENMYFDGIKSETSRLLGAVFVGDIPLPVVEHNGFIYPTIFPYVDFEDQQFIYNTSKQFFVYNNNPKGQPEIWHGLLNFGSEVKDYQSFFKKLKTYLKSPSDFVSSMIRYDDFVSMKSTFLEDSLPLYINNFMFAEDIGYHRYTNLMLDYFKKTHNDSMNDLMSSLGSAAKDNPELSKILSDSDGSLDGLGSSTVPTKMLSTVIKELLKGYENLYPGVFLSTIRDNVQSSARWYKKTSENELVDGVDSHIKKLALKDSLVVGDISKGVSPVIISFNDLMEKTLDQQIEKYRWYMTTPIITDYIHQNWKTQNKKILGIPKFWCEQVVDDHYKNYYFGSFAGDISSAQEFSTYRGTFRNLDSLSGVLIENEKYGSSSGKSLGSSYGLFATQVDANRGYNLSSVAGDYDAYDANKIKIHRELVCANYYKILGIKIFCKTKKFEYVGDEEETVNDFAIRGWGGASSLNLDSGALAKNPPQYILNGYNYKSSTFPIYDLGGSTSLTGKKMFADSVLGSSLYASLIKVQDRYGSLDYPKYIKGETDNYPSSLYGPEKDGYREIIGTQKLFYTYDDLDYFRIWKNKDDKGSKKDKIVYVNTLMQSWRAPDFLGGKCKDKKEIFNYTYKTIDSRIKNISPSPDQINGTYENKFAQTGLFWKHYDYFFKNISSLEDQITFSFDTSNSDLQILLSGTKEINKNILDFSFLLSAKSGVLLSGVRSISSVYNHQYYADILSGLTSQLESAVDILPNLSLVPSLSYFDRMKEIEGLYNEETQFLSSWSTSLKTSLSRLNAKYTKLPVTFSLFSSQYSSLERIAFPIDLLEKKKATINALQNCATFPLLSFCGCQGTYKQVCQETDALITSLKDLQSKIKALSFTTEKTEIDSEPVDVEVKLIETISDYLNSEENSFQKDIYTLQEKISTIPTIDKEPEPTLKQGLSQSTSDRPIDAPRSVSFQGLGGDVVSFVYPNIYDVSVYKQQGSSLVLKTIPEIESSIRSYLQQKVKQYNTLLLQQEKKCLSYYSANSGAFDFLSKTDPLASPKTRSSIYLPEDYFIELLGSEYIYEIAELLYYQTLPVYSKKNQTYVESDLLSSRESFDLNNKISYILSGYLTQHPNTGSFITPSYNASGYEVAYINSDRLDYLSVAETPAFIQNIQKNQKISSTTENKIIESPELENDPLYSTTLAKCGIDSSYTELLFDLKEEQGKGKMPWVTALQCWRENIPGSVKFDFSLEVGPSFEEFWSGLVTNFENRNQSLKNTFALNKQPGALLSGDIGEYRTNIILSTGEESSFSSIKSIDITVPANNNRLLAGTLVPVRLSAQDFSGKSISLTDNSYYAYVRTGNGSFVTSFGTSLQTNEIIDFESTNIVYQSPVVQQKTTVTLFVTGSDVGAKESLVIVPGNIKIKYGSKILYDNDKLQSPLSFSLTGIDSTYATLPRIGISLHSQDGLPLDVPFEIRSKNGLVTPGIISSGNFVSLSTYLLNGSGQIVYLMPKYRAGNDELILEIPGLDTITIPIIIKEGSPYVVSLSTSSTLLSIGDTLDAKISVSDAWGNPVFQKTSIKIGTLGALSDFSKLVSLSNDTFEFSLKTKENGGLGYIYAFLDDIPLSDQSSAYQKIVVQKEFLPKEKLNVMYLNLFGSDWGNLWTNDAVDSGYIATIMSDSNKLLAVTTQSVDPSRLKKVISLVSQDGQMYDFVDTKPSLIFSSGQLVSQIGSVGSVSLSPIKDILIFSSKDPLSTLKSSSRGSASFVLDTSESSSFQVTDTSLTFDGELLFDTNQGFWNTGLNIILSDEMLQGYSRWNLLYQGKQIGSLFFVRKKYSLDMSQVMISNTASYEKIITFSEGTTNGKKGIGIVDVLGIFEEKGNTSIEDSDNYELGIGFRSDFKNITLFADGKTVGESTIPFASPFVINFGDPVLSRISDNQEISNVSLDLGIGDIINAEPGQSLLKVVPIDFNNDSLEDLLAVFTDGSIKLLKNYGGTHPYSDMQNLVYLSDSIKDVFVGDVDANNYPDILIRTAKNQLRVYTNNKGVIDVDGKLICLNINASQDQISTLPASVDGLQQLFFEDMDKDGNIDIITNDLLGDIKIFYGGSTKNGNNYVSTLPYACDTHWYNRQKDSIKLIKSFGVVVDSDYYIQDESLVHIKGWNIINQTGSVNENSSQNSSSDELPPSFDSVLNNFDPNSFVSLMSNYSQELANDQLLNNYTLSPISYIPSYEKELSQQDIGYKTLLQLSGNTNISIYKTYQDTNSGALLSGDNVKITTTVLGLKNNIQATYIDKLLGPWNIVADQNNVIVSFQKESGNFDPTKDIVRLNASDNLFILDNISLDKSDFLRFSYEVTYVGEPSVSIDVKDFSSLDNNKKLDTYFDILVSPLDSCKKSQWIFFNISNQNHRSYEEKFEDIQSKIDDLSNAGQQEGEKILTDAVPSTPQNQSSGDIEECDEGCASSVQNSVNDIYSQISNLGNMQDVFESWNVANLFSSGTISNLLTSSTNSFEINMDSVNTMLAPVTDGLDKILNGLCEGFKLGQSSCKPPFPFNYIPFNQAFLAPGNYHIFGCTPTLPNPLGPLFTLINQKFGAGFPAIFFPGTLQTPVGPIPMIGSSFVPIVQQMPGSDGFGLSPGFPPSGGIYPSQIRLYIVPTLTLEMGVALCFGPYAVGTNIPPLLRDLGGNCIVTSFPLYSCGGSQNTGTDIVTTESLDPWILDATRNGSCEQPLQVGSAKVLSNTIIVQQQTHVSPFRLSSRGSENSSWTMAVPRGNFGGFGYISFSSKPTKQTTTYTKTSFNTTLNLDPMQFFEGPTIDLKIKDSNAQGIIKILVKDWMGRQIKYMVNNLTKLTVNVTLPELSQMADGFGGLFSAANWSGAIASAKKDDFSKVDTSKAKNSLDKIKIIASSKQGYQQATDYANNPFESLITMFESVPLVDLSTRDIIFNIPLLTTDEIVKYESYLRSWLKNQQQTLKQWLEAFHEIASVCGGIDSNSAATQLSLLQEERKLIDAMKDTKTQQQLKTSLEKEESFLKKIVESKTITPDSNLIVNDIPAVLSDMGKQLTLFSEKIQSLPRLNFIKNCLTTESTDDKCYPWSSFDESEKKTLLSSTQQKIDNLSACATFSTSVDGFSEFYSEVTLLVRNVQQNIQILQQYKDFPLQLYKWMHFVDKYMSDILGFVSTFSSTLISWVNVNARIYAKWIDSLILIMTAIETYQVIIDISANWTKNCGTCSRDGYGAYGCSLSFLFPQIPIIPIPPFKIPNINIDLSHIDLGINIVLPRFIFVPISLPMPQLPNIPAPVDFNLAGGLDFDFTFNFDSYDIPEIPILPSPPVLPDLPSFIPKLDFSLPTLLPPAPKIPNITQEFSVTLDTIELVSKVFCILKQGIGLVGEKGIKSRVEQMTQRTWDVPIFDFFDQTVNWGVDKKLEGFDLQFDGFLQFKMDFSLFHGFLEQIASVVNSIPYTVGNAISGAVNTGSFGKALNTASSGYTKVKEFLEQDIGNVNLTFPIPAIDIDVSPLLSQTDGLEYSVAHSQLSTELQKIKSRMDDNFSMTQKLDTMISSINTPAKISPASQQLQMLQKEIESVVVKKQTEVRQLAKTIGSYDRFIAHLERNDIALVDDERLDISLSSPLFVTDQETYKRIQSQKSPLEAYMDTNSSLVDGYYQTLLGSDPNDLNMTKSDYEKTTDYLGNLQSTINSTYAKLGFQRKSYSSCSSPFLLASQELSNTSSLLAQNDCPTCGNQTQSPSSTTVSSDLSPYVRGIFVEDTLSGKMVNVVKSDSFINAIDDNYFSVDINKNGKEDVVMRDNNNIYIKYANQKSEFKNARMYKNLHVYTPPVFKFSYIDSYDDLLNKIVDENGYASFNGILVKVASPAQEIKNFKVTGQSFDAIQMSWLNQNTLGDTVDGYLLKLNHRIDTYNDKNILYRFLDDELLSKKYILLLPENTKYDSSLIDFKETYYYKSKSSSKPRNILEFLSGGSYSGVIADIQFYKPSQQTISLGLQDIPRNWQYTEVVSLKNEGTVNKPRYIPSGPWSNQIVAGRQIVADTIGPEVIITLERPSISQVVSTGSTHKGYVGTNYSLTLDWLDNVGISKMWIEQDNKIIYTKQGNALSGRVQLTGLYFTGATSLEYIVGAEDFSKNKQIQKVILNIEVPEITMKKFVPLSESSGQLIAELSHDIDQGMVVFQRERNNVWQEFSGTLANSFGGFFVGPKQTIITGSIFSLGNTIGLYDTASNEIGSISIDGNISLLPKYQDMYVLSLDLLTGTPLLRVVNKTSGNTVFWIQIPSYGLQNITLYQKEPFYSKVDLTQSSFGSFVGGSCIQSLDKECLLYISPKGSVYIPRDASSTLTGEYRYDTINRRVIYVIKDSLGKDIVSIAIKTNLIQ